VAVALPGLAQRLAVALSSFAQRLAHQLAMHQDQTYQIHTARQAARCPVMLLTFPLCAFHITAACLHTTPLLMPTFFCVACRCWWPLRRWWCRQVSHCLHHVPLRWHPPCADVWHPLSPESERCCYHSAWTCDMQQHQTLLLPYILLLCNKAQVAEANAEPCFKGQHVHHGGQSARSFLLF
jgi:hypothetical protein